mmetsp:Transcript_19764/g.54962  ORF Transcript_19764/g.54962 Transcript_19764/m.54962 type:complete len:217 (-) Transcript_19764:556-1206(-)
MMTMASLQMLVCATILSSANVHAFSVPATSLRATRVMPPTALFATDNKDKEGVFSQDVQDEAKAALESVGWARPGADEEMTSEDPFVQQINAEIRRDVGVDLDELLNPAKVVNLERDLYNYRVELASLTGATVADGIKLTTEICDNGGGGEDADALRKRIQKKETDLSIERRSVFRGWLKNIFLGQAVLSLALSYVMATNPASLFGQFPWFYSYNM